MSRQNEASSALLRAVCERRFARFRKAFTRDLTLTAKYNDDVDEGDDDDSGWRTDDLSSDGPNEDRRSDTGMSRGGVGSKDTWSMVCDALGCAMMK